MSAGTFVVVGPHILDVLGRPVTAIPPGQGSALLDALTITVAGTGGGTAVDLARLGASVRSVGAVGDDAPGRFLRQQLGDCGVDTSGLVEVTGVPTSATILPIRPNGERPALHLPGATAHLDADDIDPRVFADVDFVHVGGPDVLGEFATTAMPGLLTRAREAGAQVSLDLLSTASPDVLERLLPVLAQVDHVLINDDQAGGLTGEADPATAGRIIRSTGPAQVVVSCGARGGVLVDHDGDWSFPALGIQAVDTTGCGDAFSAGYLYGLSLGWPARACCGLGTCCAAQVAQVLGSDGIAGPDVTLDLMRREWEPLVADLLD